MSNEIIKQQIEIGGKTVTVSRLEGNEGREHPKLYQKLVSRDDLANLGDELRRSGVRISFTTGVYDMIHIGHVRYLELARSLGDVLVVGLNTDNSVRELKGPDRPILDEMKRAEMLSFLEAVDYIVLFPETNGAETIRLLKPDSYLCVEGSWEGDIATKEEVQVMAEHGGGVYHTPRQDPILSTTEIINKIGDQVGTELLQGLQKLMAERRQNSSSS